MKFVLILLFLMTQKSFAQNLVGYNFSSENKSTPFKLELNPFATDGCTKYADGTKENPTLWQHCCLAHDAAYWLGGTEPERLKADQELYSCVKATGDDSPARLMYLGTRAGGGPLGQNTYRWGFGWNRVRDYRTLTPEEMSMAYAMYGENLEVLKKEMSENKFPVTVPESYSYVSPFPYSFCEEEIINHLSPLLSRTATVTKYDDFQIGNTYVIKIGLDICDESVEFHFSNQTNPQTCKKDYAESKSINKFSNVNVSNKCLKRIKGL